MARSIGANTRSNGASSSSPYALAMYRPMGIAVATTTPMKTTNWSQLAADISELLREEQGEDEIDRQPDRDDQTHDIVGGHRRPASCTSSASSAARTMRSSPRTYATHNAKNPRVPETNTMSAMEASCAPTVLVGTVLTALLAR